jgi:hypothetical protein
VIVYVTLPGRRAWPRFLAGEGVLRRFLDALALPVPPPGQEIVEDVADGLAACPGQARAGEPGVVAGDANGDGEGALLVKRDDVGGSF